MGGALGGLGQGFRETSLGWKSQEVHFGFNCVPFPPLPQTPTRTDKLKSEVSQNRTRSRDRVFTEVIKSKGGH